MKAGQFWVVGLLHNKWTNLGMWCRQLESTGTAAAASFGMALPLFLEVDLAPFILQRYLKTSHGSAFVCGMASYPPILCHELFLKLRLVLLLEGLKCTRVQALK